MRYLTAILFLIITGGGLLSCGAGADQSELAGTQDVVIVGGDTLGRNWDNLATEEEANKARELGITPEQYIQLKEQEQQRIWQASQAEQGMLEPEYGVDPEIEKLYDFEPTSFSDKMHQEKTYTVESNDGREIVVGSRDEGQMPKTTD